MFVGLRDVYGPPIWVEKSKSVCYIKFSANLGLLTAYWNLILERRVTLSSQRRDNFDAEMVPENSVSNLNYSTSVAGELHKIERP